MTDAQLWTILLTGLLAIAASAVGQYIGGLMAARRARAEADERERQRFTETKRDLYLEAIGVLTKLTRDSKSPNHLLPSLALFDSAVAMKYHAAAQARVVLADVSRLRLTQRRADPHMTNSVLMTTRRARRDPGRAGLDIAAQHAWGAQERRFKARSA